MLKLAVAVARSGKRVTVVDLDLRRPIFTKTAAYGHFGREDRDFTWERTDKADALRDAARVASAASARVVSATAIGSSMGAYVVESVAA